MACKPKSPKIGLVNKGEQLVVLSKWQEIWIDWNHTQLVFFVGGIGYYMNTIHLNGDHLLAGCPLFALA